MSTGESSQPLLLIDRLTVTLPTAARPLVDGVTMRVDRGEIVGLVGESGSGKSVTAKAVLGLLPARAVASGRVLLAGIDMLTADASTVRRSRLRTAAMVFQDPRAAVNPVRSVGDFLTEGLRALPGVSRRTALSRAAHLLDQVGIADSVRALRRYPHEFSGGMLQRVVIAAALAGDPDLLLADEPTTALDPTTQAEVLAILLRLRAERGLGMVFVTHDLDLAAALCHRVCVMYAGRIVETGQAENLFREPRHPYTEGLLAASPRLDADRPMTPIPGRPLSLAETTPGCPFAPRCGYVEEDCVAAVPPVAQADRPACFHPVASQVSA